MPESVASIDSLSLASDDSSYDTEEEILAEQEWNESVEQLQQLMSLVLLPYLGKWFGRKCSYWLYERYIRLGFGKQFFLG